MATFVSKFVPKNFQKSPNLVTLKVEHKELESDITLVCSDVGQRQKYIKKLTSWKMFFLILNCFGLPLSRQWTLSERSSLIKIEDNNSITKKQSKISNYFTGKKFLMNEVVLRTSLLAFPMNPIFFCYCWWRLGIGTFLQIRFCKKNGPYLASFSLFSSFHHSWQ